MKSELYEGTTNTFGFIFGNNIHSVQQKKYKALKTNKREKAIWLNVGDENKKSMLEMK